MGKVRVQQQRRAACAEARAPQRWTQVALALSAVLTCSAAQAQADSGGERVQVLTLVDSGVGADATRRITSVLRTEVAAVLGTRYVEASGAQANERCALESLATCGAGKGKQAGADLVVLGTVAALADVQLVDLRVIDVASAAEVGRLQSPLGSTAEENRRVLRELAVRLLVPEAYVGTLVVDNLVAGDVLLVDGAEVATEIPTTRVALSVGQHAIEVVYGEQSRLSDVVDIAFEQVRTARVGGDGDGPDAAASAGAEAPGWPFWAAVSVGTLAAAATVGLVVTYFFADSERAVAVSRSAEAKKPDAQVVCPNTSDNYFVCFDDAAAYWESVALNALIGAGASALIAAGSAGAAVLLFPSGSEAGEATPAQP